eukprot:TRINITY_DN60510_c0_g1_i1.p1 TRINITY_DN60510_c0_g1~~TRINITY_DN60510_c0_g1_i1.p1  ORF type:complete len:280 (+),score=69.51 TRINITY_DN60510_c0_g1_i1:2-841(+)
MLRQGASQLHRETAIRCVTLDLTGTVLWIRQPVEHTYCDAAAWGLRQRRARGNTAPPLYHGPVPTYEEMSIGFRKAFGETLAEHPCFGYKSGLSSKEWWMHAVRRAFLHCGCEYPEGTFQRIFRRIYQHYGTLESHGLFEDVPRFVDWAKERDIVLGVVTNNLDRAVDCTLPMLGVADDFDFFTVSAEVGEMKPDQGIFQHALQLARSVDPSITMSACLHIGDNYGADYMGARNAGMKALYLQRAPKKGGKGVVPFPGDPECAEGRFAISSLDEAMRIL